MDEIVQYEDRDRLCYIRGGDRLSAVVVDPHQRGRGSDRNAVPCWAKRAGRKFAESELVPSQSKAVPSLLLVFLALAVPFRAWADERLAFGLYIEPPFAKADTYGMVLGGASVAIHVLSWTTLELGYRMVQGTEQAFVRGGIVIPLLHGDGDHHTLLQLPVMIGSVGTGYTTHGPPAIGGTTLHVGIEMARCFRRWGIGARVLAGRERGAFRTPLGNPFSNSVGNQYTLGFELALRLPHVR